MFVFTTVWLLDYAQVICYLSALYLLIGPTVINKPHAIGMSWLNVVIPERHC